MTRSKAILMALLALAFGGAEAAPVTVQQVRRAARAWATGGSGRRFGMRFGSSVDSVASLAATNGRPFYAVKMLDGGTILMSGDTADEPVLAFTPDASGLPSIEPGSPLWALLNGDMNLRRRAEEVRASLATASSSATAAKTSAESRWAALLSETAADSSGSASGLETAMPIDSDSDVDVLDDLRVARLVKTKWGQSTLSGRNCFNYYTPGHCVCGCVATAFAQTMRYHQWPSGEVASFTGKCSYKGAVTNITTAGGVFDWANMPETALDGDAEIQAQAIGRLTFECGVAVGMAYDMPDGTGSGASTEDIVTALKGKFGYAGARWCGNATDLTDSEAFRERYVYPSLDAGCPVVFSIRGSTGGHAVVGDGYGYDGVNGVMTPYIHLNMGWTGQNDWWYNFPNIDTGNNPEKFTGFDTVTGLAYDIFPEKTGRIVSGRVLDADGEPAAGVTVTLNGLEATTSDTGVFAFISSADELPAGTHVARATSGSYIGAVEVTVGGEGGNGDCWGNEIALAYPSVRVASSGTIYSALDFAIDAAQEDDTIEILKPTSLRHSRLVGVSCTIRPAAEYVSEYGCDAVTNCFAAGATLTVSNGVRVLFENVAFTNAAKRVALAVREGGTAAVKGFVGVDEIDTEDADGFELAGLLRTAFFLDCSGNALAADVIGRVTAAEPLGDCASNIRNRYNEELGGTVSGTDLVWGAQPVPDAAAVVRLYSEGGSTHANYLSLGTLFNYVEPGTTIVVCRDCAMTQTVEVAGDLAIVAADGCTVSNLSAACFVVTDGTLTVSNTVFSGYSGDGTGLFSVNGDGAKLVLGNGTRILGRAEGSVDRPLSALTVRSGAATLLPGCEILGWESRNPEIDCGGAVTVCSNAVLNLLGGRIAGCRSAAYGGGVYAERFATVNIGGDVIVKGNFGTRDTGAVGEDDISLCDSTSVLNLTDEITSADGSVGVSYVPPTSLENEWGWGNGEGDSFITVETGATAAEASAAKFFCTEPEESTGDTMIGAVSEDGGETLVWKDVGRVCPPDEAVVAVIYAGDGGLATNHYRLVDEAVTELNGKIKKAATVELLCSAVFSNDVKIAYAVTFRSRGASPFVLTRGTACGFDVKSGASLVVTNLTVSGADERFDKTLVTVSGGSLTLADGATVRDVVSGALGVAGVAVDKGVFTMEGGSAILNCRNTYTNELDETDVSLGGGLWANDATVRLNGGQIFGCRACRGGGAYFTISSRVSVSGDFTASGNNNAVSASSAGPNVFSSVDSGGDGLVLNGDFAGSVGLCNDASESTNEFGTVDATYFASADLEKVAAGAAGFYREFPGDAGNAVKGRVVTNATEALLVWSTAVVDGVYEDDEGNRYGEISSEPTPTPVSVEPIAFKSISRVSEAEWALVVTNRVEGAYYRLLWTQDLTKGFTSTGGWEHATASGEWTTNVLFTAPVPAAVFWRAEGRDGEKESE